jgi:hypothetical protein
MANIPAYPAMRVQPGGMVYKLRRKKVVVYSKSTMPDKIS